MLYRQIDMNLLVVLNELLRSGSVQRASKSLGVTQGAVSQSLAKLRRHFGDELFVKTNTGVVPTSIALSLADDVRQSVAFAEAALVNRVQFDGLESQRDIKICMGDMGEIRILPRILEVFGESAPGCRVVVLDLWGEDLKHALERGEVDLAINARTPPLGNILQQKLFEDQHILLASKSNALDREITVAEFGTAPQIAVSSGGASNPNLDDALAASGMRRKVALWVSNWLAVPHLLEAQPSLLAMVPKCLARAYGRFDLKTITTTFDLPKIEVYQYWHRRANAETYNVWLRNKVREMFGKPAEVVDDRLH